MDTISPPIQSLLELFTTTLADVRFGDVDAQTLARLAADVQAAAAVVASVQSTLDQAREALQERQDALLQQSNRALAYARVFAENDPALSERIAEIALPRTRRVRSGDEALVLSPDPQPAARPRGRPRKVEAAEPMLDGMNGMNGMMAAAK
jgi:multidrug efflux pump subunit AcrA (membrane-fusion protein)